MTGGQDKVFSCGIASRCCFFWIPGQARNDDSGCWIFCKNEDKQLTVPDSAQKTLQYDLLIGYTLKGEKNPASKRGISTGGTIELIES
jgi:hypothetical protein